MPITSPRFIWEVAELENSKGFLSSKKLMISPLGGFKLFFKNVHNVKKRHRLLVGM